MQEHYEYVFRLRYYGTELFIVGCPVSPFCVVDARLWFSPTAEDIQKASQWLEPQDPYLMGRIRWRVHPNTPEQEYQRLNIRSQFISFYFPVVKSNSSGFRAVMKLVVLAVVAAAADRSLAINKTRYQERPGKLQWWGSHNERLGFTQSDSQSAVKIRETWNKSHLSQKATNGNKTTESEHKSKKSVLREKNKTVTKEIKTPKNIRAAGILQSDSTQHQIKTHSGISESGNCVRGGACIPRREPGSSIGSDHETKNTLSSEVFDWKLIDKLTEGKNLPVLRRVKRFGDGPTIRNSTTDFVKSADHRETSISLTRRRKSQVKSSPSIYHSRSDSITGSQTDSRHSEAQSRFDLIAESELSSKPESREYKKTDSQLKNSIQLLKQGSMKDLSSKSILLSPLELKKETGPLSGQDHRKQIPFIFSTPKQTNYPISRSPTNRRVLSEKSKMKQQDVAPTKTKVDQKSFPGNYFPKKLILASQEISPKMYLTAAGNVSKINILLQSAHFAEPKHRRIERERANNFIQFFHLKQIDEAKKNSDADPTEIMHSNSSDNSSTHIHLRILVSKDGVKVSVDHMLVYSSWREFVSWGDETRRLHAGVHVLSLDAATGLVTRTAKLLTWQRASAKELVRELRAINQGRIVLIVGAVRKYRCNTDQGEESILTFRREDFRLDLLVVPFFATRRSSPVPSASIPSASHTPDFLRFLSEEATKEVMELGSLLLDHLVEYESFVLVARTGGGPVAEAARTKYSLQWYNKTDNDGPPLLLETAVRRAVTDRCAGQNKLDADHKTFCELYEGYGAFCACNGTLLPYMQPDSESSRPSSIAVGLIGGQRLARTLDQVRVIRNSCCLDGGPTPMVMFLDEHLPEAELLARILNISVNVHANMTFRKGSAARVNSLIQHAVSHVFQAVPTAQFAIILEDDLQLAPDFMSYFEQTASLLADPSELLLCVSAYNYNAYPDTASNLSRLVRHQGAPAYGWMITKVVATELSELDHWPLEFNPSDWDYYMKANLMNTRHILAPEIPRTRHVGGGGVHVTGLEQESHYDVRAFNDHVTYVTLDIESARRSNYYAYHRHMMNSSIVVDLNRIHPCDPHLFAPYPEAEAFTFYLDMPTENDEHGALNVVMKCLGASDRGEKEHLLHMYHYHYRGRLLYMVACPQSYYCDFKMSGGPLYRPTQEDKARADSYFLQRHPMTQSISYRLPSQDPIEDALMENAFFENFSQGSTTFFRLLCLQSVPHDPTKPLNTSENFLSSSCGASYSFQSADVISGGVKVKR
ncbi:Glycosyl transferase family 13 [Trinorchestia longiramus]|nr:Glycosyl transferase family 13 [Trinorchestia longiramus]